MTANVRNFSFLRGQIPFPAAEDKQYTIKPHTLFLYQYAEVRNDLASIEKEI